MDMALQVARGHWPADSIEDVLARRRAEVAAIVTGRPALEFVLRAAARSLGGADVTDLGALRARQRVFIDAARTIAAGVASAGYLAELGRPP